MEEGVPIVTNGMDEFMIDTVKLWSPSTALSSVVLIMVVILLLVPEGNTTVNSDGSV